VSASGPRPADDAAQGPPWAGLGGVLFDVDGTLYDQGKLRLLMGLELVRFALGHGTRAAGLVRSIVCFRRTREALRALGQPAGSLEELQYREAARRAGTDETQMREVVEEWMLRRPLRHLARCRRPGVRELLGLLRERGLKVGVFSDYPGRAKLAALGLMEYVSLTVCATDPEVNAFKPHPQGLQHACRQWALPPQAVLYVGDRPEVDAVGAAALGMPCAILSRPASRARSADAAPHFAFSSFADLRQALGG